MLPLDDLELTRGAAVNYRLKKDDISYIFQHSDCDVIIVDAEFEPLLSAYREACPSTPIIIDTDTDAIEGELCGPFNKAVLEGLEYDKQTGGKGWAGLEAQAPNEDDVFALAFTSGTTARPKGVEYTHRNAYLAALGNVVESGLCFHNGRCKYLWTLPMFHACGGLPLLKPTFNVRSKWIHRLDVPMGSHRCTRYALLSPENRLPRDLEALEARGDHTFQRSAHCKHIAMQRQGS